jgi:hypothetical protein
MTVGPRRRADRLVAVAVLFALAGCSSTPPPPDWQMNAKSALEHAAAAYLQGNPALEASEFARARREIAATGRTDLLARAELMRCASRVASLSFEPCSGFESLRRDAAAPEAAYAAYLMADTVEAQQLALLPAHHRTLAASATAPAAALSALKDMPDPLSRLVGAAVLMRGSRASPDVVAFAVDTASAQGWRRALLAWLQVQARGAEQAGDAATAQRLRRRIALVEAGP